MPDRSSSLSHLSLERLKGVHPHLVAIVRRAADTLTASESALAFEVSEGVRSVERQKQLVAQGASRTMNSRHIPAANGFSHAVDLVVYVDGRISWEFPCYKKLSDIVKKAATELGHPVEWGGDWQSFRDGPHFQLPHKIYPGIVKAGDPPAPEPTQSETDTLVIGSAGQRVVAMQHALNRHGAALFVDGDFGPITWDALVKFQRGHGLPADGVAGPLTWAKLKAPANG